MEPVWIGRNSHIEDNCVVHMSNVRAKVMVGHGAVLDAATIGEQTFVASNTTINRGATIGSQSVVAAGAVIPDTRTVPPRSFVRGVPATVTPLEDTAVDADAIFDTHSPDIYRDLVRRHDELFE